MSAPVEQTTYQKSSLAFREMLRTPEAAATMARLVGGDRSNIGPCALGSLAEELMLLSHYCADARDAAAALTFLEDVLLRMSERASAAADLAAAELQVVLETAPGRQAAE